MFNLIVSNIITVETSHSFIQIICYTLLLHLLLLKVKHNLVNIKKKFITKTFQFYIIYTEMSMRLYMEVYGSTLNARVLVISEERQLLCQVIFIFSGLNNNYDTSTEIVRNIF